ncbi:FAD-binding oxidoreductase [Leifsonia flava]|uniref:FAD-binding oxidoreductase n=1 Tax=Orlajensenia leifsoniae TaxID=2561933 RepID=UPI001430E05C|nr:FAD-binding protein [Leifsonia flava]
MSSSTPPAITDLQRTLSGAVVLPADSGYDAARSAWNLTVDQRPVAVVTPADVDEVRAVLAAAAASGLGVTVQPNGHGANGSLEGVVLIRPTAFDEITLDQETRTARVGAGVNWGRVLTALDGTGLVALAGSNPEVNTVGYSIGGGHSMFSRAYGLASRSVTAVELVDAGGEARRVTASSDPELFWALRGGGGLFGVITAIEFALHPADTLFGGSIVFPITVGIDAIVTGFDLAAVDPTLGLDISLARFPDMPQLPPPLRGQTIASVAFVHIGDAASAAPIVDRLRSIGTPLLDGLTSFTIGGLAAVAAEPTDPMPTVDWGGAVDGFDRATATEFVGAFLAGVEGGLSRVSVRPLGGAIAADPDVDDAAIGALDAQALISSGVLAFTPEMAAGADAALEPLRRFAAAHPTTGMVPTFLGSGTGLADAFDAGALDRLRAVKDRVDPGGLIRSNRALPE